MGVGGGEEEGYTFGRGRHRRGGVERRVMATTERTGRSVTAAAAATGRRRTFVGTRGAVGSGRGVCGAAEACVGRGERGLGAAAGGRGSGGRRPEAEKIGRAHV